MDDTQFAQWARLLERRTGTRVPPARRSFLVTSVKLRMRELGCDDYQAYFDYIHSGRQGAAEWAMLVDRLTVHETRFFRHEGSLNLIRDLYLPELTRRITPPYAIEVWSMGCATGEEPYTLAMILDEHLQRAKPGVYFGITASDISLPALAEARRGVYHQRKLKGVPVPLLRKYFTPHDPEHFEICEGLRRRVCFHHLNVLDADREPLGAMDIIMCQNLLIYFERDLRNEILDKLAANLKPGGLLVLGLGEALGWSHPHLEKVQYEDSLAFVRTGQVKGGGL